MIVDRSWCHLAFRHGEFPVFSQANHGYRVRWNMKFTACPVVKRCDGFTDRQKLLLVECKAGGAQTVGLDRPSKQFAGHSRG